MLIEQPTGAPLLYLAPKQSTFQIERELLASGELLGYTRLSILSFERLAQFILEELCGLSPRVLTGEGRVMVLRALLARHGDRLEIFHAIGRLRGFAQQLSGTLRELQHAGVNAGDLDRYAMQLGGDHQLDAKLRDLALLMRAYQEWLAEHQMVDEEQMLLLATEALQPLRSKSPPADPPDMAAMLADPGVRQPVTAGFMVPMRGPQTAGRIRLGGLWMDGFGEMSRQEMELVAALVPLCESVAVTFNLDASSFGSLSWLNTWSTIAQTYRQIRGRMEGIDGIELVENWIDRGTPEQRFGDNKVLQHLERHWQESVAFSSDQIDEAELPVARNLRISACPTREEEAQVAAREIRKFVRAGGRYREAAVLVRQLDPYAEAIRRIFARHVIPCFLDRREPVGHHPLAELTRGALRLVAFDWRNEDWFAVLKTGLVTEDDGVIDQIENAALIRGWKGKAWLEPIAVSDASEQEQQLEVVRAEMVEPFVKFRSSLGERPNGRTLAACMDELWRAMGVEARLEEWSRTSGERVHSTLWQQMLDWLDVVLMAFESDGLGLRDWSQVVDAGLAEQTVGVIPPALDQVLVGAVDRTRNPDLKLVIVLGMNEGVFPQSPSASGLLTDSDRESLTGLNVRLGLAVRDKLSLEQYLGYVACTRSRDRLVLTHALRDEEGSTLNPSPFVLRIQRLFPQIAIDSGSSPSVEDAETPRELLPAVLEIRRRSAVLSTGVTELVEFVENTTTPERAWNFRTESCDDRLTREAAAKLYGTVLKSSVSRIEEFGVCPFRFFVTSGLRVEERRLFEIDARERGGFQHEILARYHNEVTAMSRRWRDVSPQEAREWIGRIGLALAAEFRDGLFRADDRSKFEALSETQALQDFIEVLTGWMKQYEFDPVAVELGFGQEGDSLPPWRIEAGAGRVLEFRGKIDRVDLWKDPRTGRGICVVMDYKARKKVVDPVLQAHGIQVQLPAYLNVLKSLPGVALRFGVTEIEPAGMFYVNLRGTHEGQKGRTRTEILADAESARRKAYCHFGRFNREVVSLLDRRGEKKGDQFRYERVKEGAWHARSTDPKTAEEFARMIGLVETKLSEMAARIFDGVAEVDPYRKGSTVGCDICGYASICRIDPATHAYRDLRVNDGEP